MALTFKGAFRAGARGRDVSAVKRTLRSLGHVEVIGRGRFGPPAVSALKLFQRRHGLKPDGVYGPSTHLKLEPKMKGYARWLYAHAKLRKTHGAQVPVLPRFWPASVFWIDNGGGRGEYGVQPALVPQIQAICKEFGLVVTAGYGGHPPHAYRSDHRVGLAVDLAGSYENMVKATLWADGLVGHTFRWVGGPAHDANGVEPGHSNHVHLSWYRTKPTTIFGTTRFK